MSYISEIIETSPNKEDVEIKAKSRIDEMIKKGYSLISRSYVGNAWAILVFGTTKGI